jgi:glycosyltransferase involved in cell wall biosynthesis
MIRVLHVISSLQGSGGVQHLLLNYYRHMDSREVHFDFIVHDEKIEELEPVFISLGCKVYHVTQKQVSLRKHLFQLREIIKNGNYNVVHCHQQPFFALRYAKKYNVPVRIAHGHIAISNVPIITRISGIQLKILIKHYATHWFACSILAGKWLFGKRAVEKNKVRIINNAIELDKYIYNTETRKEVRKSMGIEDKIVIGHVGRFTEQKNHEFLINVFNEVYKTNDNAVLLLVGDGELLEKIKALVQRLHLTNAVRFLGLRNDVPDLLQAMDAFLLPSRFEGLPVVLVETQAAALFSLVSDSVTQEINVTDYIMNMSLADSPYKWAAEILRHTGYSRINTRQVITAAGYDVEREAGLLNSFYIDTVYNQK